PLLTHPLSTIYLCTFPTRRSSDLADITPPVCLAAYAGAGIARANPFKSGVNAVKLAIAAFLIPYIFVYNPILVGVDVTVLKLVVAVVTAVIGMIAVGSSMIGFFKRYSKLWERGVLLIGGIFMITPGLITNLISIILMAVV